MCGEWAADANKSVAVRISVQTSRLTDLITLICSQERIYLLHHQVLLVFERLRIAELVKALILLGHDDSPLEEGFVLDLVERPEEHILVAWVYQ